MPSQVEGTAERHASALDEVLCDAVSAAGAHIGAIYLLNETDQVLLMEAEIGLPAQIVRPWTRVRLNACVPAAAAVRQRHLIWVPSHQDMARRFPATALALPYSFAAAAVPIQTGARVWGCWVLMWPPSHPPDLNAQEMDVIDLASRKLGDLLRQADSEGQPPHPSGEPRVLTPAPKQTPDPEHAAGAFTYLDRLHEGCVALDLEGRITFVSATAAELLGGDVSGLLGRTLWDVMAWLKDPLFEDRCRAAVVSQEMARCVARRPDGRELECHLYPDSSGISLRLTLVPLRDQEPPAHETGSRAHGLPRPEVFYNFVHLAAALTRAQKVREIIDLFADHVMPVFEVQAMAVVIAECGKLKIIGSRGYDSEVLDRFDGLPLTTPTPSERVLRTGVPMFFANRSELRQMYPYVAHYDQMSAWAFLPLAGAEGRIGSCVLAFGTPRSFSGEDRAGLTTLTGLMSQALDRALLYDAKERLAQSLQEVLLPRRLPEIPGLAAAARYLPATRGVGIGGDFYDLIRLSDSLAMAVIGDVQGHNITAAALMGQVRTSIRAHAAAGAEPGEVLTHTNRLLIETETDLFASCLLVQVDLRLRTLSAASAGHPPPLLRPPNAPGEIIDVPVGLLLGVEDNIHYPTTEVPFPPGALLALYTDGLVETPGVDLDEAIGEVADHLTRASNQPLSELCDSLLDDIPHGARRIDDIALLLLEHRSGHS
ncbi:MULTISPECIES: SpoIIE family protein phosphatase [unclassified Nonomuraea]|uniref:SpoIIE family protein phosphatase n=1 Tax=unclassified Nonomuraea TaxID=2593643 RepID=UPI0035BF80F9